MTASLGLENAMVATFGIQAIAETTAQRIADCLFAGTLIALFAGIVSRFSRGQSSGVRFGMWYSTLVALAVSPFLPDSMWAARHAAAPSGLNGSSIVLPGSWALYISILWLAIASLFLLRVGIGLWRLRSLRKTFVPVDLADLDESVLDTLRCGFRQGRVVLFTSERVQVPAAIGLMSPLVVVPRWALDELSSAELNLVLLHEVAHLRRLDSWTNLAQQVVKALLFFHPAVWWIERKLSLEREMACDDAVLAESESPRAYAECLKHIAERSFLRRSFALAQAVLGQVRQTSMRVARILEGNHSRSAKHGWRAAFSLAALLIAFGMIEANEPHLIAFQNAQPLLQNAATLHAPAVTPVSFKTVEAIAPRSASRSNPVRVLAANHHASRSAALITAEKPVPLMAAAKPPATMLHLASVRAVGKRHSELMTSDAVFVVFETSGLGPGGQPIYEIEVLHVTVMRPSASFVTSEILHKEI